MRISIFKNQKVNETEIVSPCEGKLKRLERASDSQIYAPVSGVVTSIFPTKHAIGIQTKNGMDVMLHIGVDTVKLQKNTIESRLQVHDVVKKMQPICEIDLITFKKLGILPDVYVFVTNSAEYDIKAIREEQDIYEGDVVLKCIRR